MQGGLPAGGYEIIADDRDPSPVESPAAAAHRPTGLAVGPGRRAVRHGDVGGRVYKVRYEGEGA